MSEEIPPASQRSTFFGAQDHSTGRGLRAALLLASVMIIGFGVHSASGVLGPILLGALFAAAAQPAAKFFEERLRLPSSVAVLASLLGVLVLLIIASSTVFWGFLDIASNLSRYEAALVELQSNLARGLSRAGLSRFAALVHRGGTSDVLPAAVRTMLDAVPSIFGFATLASLVTLFGLIERDSLVQRLCRRDSAARTWESVVGDTQRYLAVKSAVGAITGLATGLLCALFGLPNAALWGAIAFWLNYVPILGSLVAGIPPVAIALVFVSPAASIAVGIGYGIIKFILGNLVEPKWQGHSAGLSPLVVVLSIAIWGGLLGPIGALLSVPLTMVVKIGCAHTRDLNWFADLLASDPPARRSLLPLIRPLPKTPDPSFGPRESASL